MEGLVPHIKFKSLLYAKKKLGTFTTHTYAHVTVCVHTCARARTHTHTHRKHSTFYTSTFKIYYEVYTFLKALYHLLERWVCLSATC